MTMFEGPMGIVNKGADAVDNPHKRKPGKEQVFDGWSRDEYNAMVAAEVRNFGTNKEYALERRIEAIADCIIDSFTPPLDQGTAMHIARKIVALPLLKDRA